MTQKIDDSAPKTLAERIREIEGAILGVDSGRSGERSSASIAAWEEDSFGNQTCPVQFRGTADQLASCVAHPKFPSDWRDLFRKAFDEIPATPVPFTPLRNSGADTFGLEQSQALLLKACIPWASGPASHSTAYHLPPKPPTLPAGKWTEMSSPYIPEGKRVFLRDRPSEQLGAQLMAPTHYELPENLNPSGLSCSYLSAFAPRVTTPAFSIILNLAATPYVPTARDIAIQKIEAKWTYWNGIFESLEMPGYVGRYCDEFSVPPVKLDYSIPSERRYGRWRMARNNTLALEDQLTALGA